MRASDEGYDHILEHLSSHLTDLQDLFMIHLLLTAVVQRYLVGDERETQGPQSACLATVTSGTVLMPARAAGGKEKQRGLLIKWQSSLMWHSR